jgi:Xaa-Pro dipeptidase
MNASSTSIYTIRQQRLSAALKAADLDALALNPGPSLVYLTGLHFHLMERPVVALFTPDAPPVIVLPELEGAKVQALPYPARAFSYGEDPAGWAAVFSQAIHAAEVNAGRLAVEPTRLRVLELRLLEAGTSQAQFVSGEETLAGLRMQKDENEIAWMQKAVQIAQVALQATLPAVRVGVTERELAAELTLQMLRAGCEPELPFAPIVAAGPNSANPHAVPSERALANGDLLLFDWGAIYEGYISDLTRTFAIGEVDPELKRIAAIVAEANAAGRAAAGPGVTAGQVDTAAREVIVQAGYGPQFFHRLGHGIGMEGHEAPYIRGGSDLVLQAGMTFTIEPGIYLTGRGGVRIEDNVAITAGGAACLSDLPRELIVLGG